MRTYMTLLEYAQAEDEMSVAEVAPAMEELDANDIDIASRLEDVIFNLRSYTDGDGRPDYSLGVEAGCEMAADMVENLLKSVRGQ